MKYQPASVTEDLDSAAVFACSVSLWEECRKRAEEERVNLSECYHGFDQLMREVVRIGTMFEEWACRHVDFESQSEVWPYFLGDRFGETCLDLMSVSGLAEFNESDCLRIALRLRIPLNLDEGLPMPVDVLAPNPAASSTFRQFRIQTVRNSVEDDDVHPYTTDDEPFDSDFGSPYFGLYGVGGDGLLEHIADRRSYAEMLSLVSKLVPEVSFPDQPCGPPSSPSTHRGP